MLKNNYLQKKYISSQAGFTLVEMLVVFVILAILATVVLAGYRSGQKRYALSQAAQQSASDLRRAQNMAMSGIDIEGQYYGYGVYAEKDNTFYIIYGDENGNSTYQPSDATIETVYLPSIIKIQAVLPLPNKVDVFFRPPDPTTYINGNAGSGLSGTIILQIEDDPSSTKTVTVTTAGRIQID